MHLALHHCLHVEASLNISVLQIWSDTRIALFCGLEMTGNADSKAAVAASGRHVQKVMDTHLPFPTSLLGKAGIIERASSTITLVVDISAGCRAGMAGVAASKIDLI